MDGLSAAASIIAVIQISAQVFDLCRTYYLNVKDARKDIQRLQNEISSLHEVLVSVVDLAENPNATSLGALDLINQKDGLLKQCEIELTALAAQLDPGGDSKMNQLVFRTLKWPFSSKDVEKVLVTIGRYKSTFLLALTTDQTKLSLAIGRDVLEIKNQIETKKEDDHREDIIHWLATTDPSTNYHASCTKCQPDTGNWLVESEAFNNWVVSQNSLLWLFGIPGCGKTILSSTIIQHLNRQFTAKSKYAVVYFYFDFKTIAKQEVSACMSSIVAQLCGKVSDLPEYVKQVYKRCNFGKLQGSVGDLEEMLFKLVNKLEQVFIIIDALDECPKNAEREQLLAAICSMKSKSLPNLHVLVTSRREPDIEEVLLPLLTSPAIPLQGSRVDMDIKIHISRQLETDTRLKKWSEEIKKEIEDTLMNGANGMFRWVVCQLEALKKCLKINLIREALKNLPKTLDDTYERLFLEIDEAYQQEARNALLWLAFSERPLKLTELAEAIVIDPQTTPPFNPEQRFPDPQSVFHILSSLITISSSEQKIPDDENIISATVTLAHFSVKEYLISERIYRSQAQHFAASDSFAQQYIAKCCLLYILEYASSAIKSESPTDLTEFPLLQYSSTSWYTHIKLATPQQQKELVPLVMRLLLSDSALSSWLQVHNPGRPAMNPFDQFAELISPLMYTSDMGLVLVMEKFLADGWDPNGSSQGFEAPLHRAAILGHEELVLLLLKSGAEANTRDFSGFTPLHNAVGAGNITIVQMLLHHGAEINAADGRGWTPLHAAAFLRRGQIARLLIESGASVEVTTKDTNRTPLHWAAWNEDEGLLELLIQQGANVNAQNSDGETALHYAARHNQDILRNLLALGADPDVKTKEGESPLYWALTNHEEEPAEILVAAGAKIDVPLLALAKVGFHSAFHLLVRLLVSDENKEKASIGRRALEEFGRRECGLCDMCRTMLHESFMMEVAEAGIESNMKEMDMHV